jgi:hypothetical protein
MVFEKDSRASFMGETLPADVKAAVEREPNIQDVASIEIHGKIVKRPANAPRSWVVAVDGDHGQITFSMVLTVIGDTQARSVRTRIIVNYSEDQDCMMETALLMKDCYVADQPLLGCFFMVKYRV